MNLFLQMLRYFIFNESVYVYVYLLLHVQRTTVYIRILLRFNVFPCNTQVSSLVILRDSNICLISWPRLLRLRIFPKRHIIPILDVYRSCFIIVFPLFSYFEVRKNYNYTEKYKQNFDVSSEGHDESTILKKIFYTYL